MRYQKSLDSECLAAPLRWVIPFPELHWIFLGKYWMGDVGNTGYLQFQRLTYPLIWSTWRSCEMDKTGYGLSRWGSETISNWWRMDQCWGWGVQLELLSRKNVSVPPLTWWNQHQASQEAKAAVSCSSPSAMDIFKPSHNKRNQQLALLESQLWSPLRRKLLSRWSLLLLF